MKNKLTPEQYIKQAIIDRAKDFFEEIKITEDITTPEGIEAAYERLDNEDFLQDARDEIRQSGEETDIPCGYSRHYESNAVAKKMDDGTWVGWDYYYGGGKHGEPSAMPWIDDAYFLECKEEEKVVVVRTFKKK